MRNQEWISLVKNGTIVFSTLRREHAMMNAGRKKKLQTWLVICLLLACVTMPHLSLGEQKVYEGPGWDTPEDAVLHYLEGLKDQDLDKMISAYAVETCIDHFDLKALLARVKAYTLGMTPRMPNSSNLLREINIEARKNQIVHSILFQITSICQPWQDFYSTIPFTEEDGGEAITAFVEGIVAAFDAVDFGTLQFLCFTPPEQVSEFYASERNQENFKAQIAPYSAEEARSVIAFFIVDGRFCVFACDTTRYGERWYIHMPGGNIGSLVGLTASSGGMISVALDELPDILGEMDKWDTLKQEAIDEYIRTMVTWFK